MCHAPHPPPAPRQSSATQSAETKKALSGVLTSLQAAWNAHGEAGLTLGECERLEDEETAYVRDALLKERVLHWRAELKAEAI